MLRAIPEQQAGLRKTPPWSDRFRTRIFTVEKGTVPFFPAMVYGDLVASNELAGFEVRERFYEIGSTAGLVETRAYLAKKLEPQRPKKNWK